MLGGLDGVLDDLGAAGVVGGDLVEHAVDGGNGGEEGDEEPEQQREAECLDGEGHGDGEMQSAAHHACEGDAEDLRVGESASRNVAEKNAEQRGEDGVEEDLEENHGHEDALARAHLLHDAVVAHAVVDHDPGEVGEEVGGQVQQQQQQQVRDQREVHVHVAAGGQFGQQWRLRGDEGKAQLVAGGERRRRRT